MAVFEIHQCLDAFKNSKQGIKDILHIGEFNIHIYRMVVIQGGYTLLALS